jgi:hypothetical protein
VNGARRNLFGRDTTARASAASPTTLTLARIHQTDRPEVPPPPAAGAADGERCNRRRRRRHAREPSFASWVASCDPFFPERSIPLSYVLWCVFVSS